MKYIDCNNILPNLMSKLKVNDLESLKRNLNQHPYQIRVVYNDLEERTVDIDSFDITMNVFYRASLKLPDVKKVFIQFFAVVRDDIVLKVYDKDDVLKNRVVPKIQELF
ncbi:hypothetical protein [Carboxylicivirga sp. RSCT41]|uniref:hypothetical protein n=1 Tax=Carboxylicivirga agarovorans TaxID=3417570 RepID=UPI003D34183D